MQKQYYEDYKYVMQDASHLYLGAKYSYEEIVENEEIPFKFRLIVERYIYDDAEPSVTMEEHLYNLTDKGVAFRTYKHIKMKVKILVFDEKKGADREGVRSYTTKVLPLETFAKMTAQEKREKGVIIQEVMCSKLALMMF